MKTLVISVYEFFDFLTILQKYNIPFDYCVGTKKRFVFRLKLNDAKILGY